MMVGGGWGKREEEEEEDAVLQVELLHLGEDCEVRLARGSHSWAHNL